MNVCFFRMFWLWELGRPSFEGLQWKRREVDVSVDYGFFNKFGVGGVPDFRRKSKRLYEVEVVEC